MITKRVVTEYNSKKLNYDFYEICITQEILDDLDTLDSILFDCQCALLFIDITDVESFNMAKELMEKFDLEDYSCLKLI